MAVPAHDERDFAFARKFGLRGPVGDPAAGRDALAGETMADAVHRRRARWSTPGRSTARPATSADAVKSIAYLEEKGVGQRQRSTTACATG